MHDLVGVVVVFVCWESLRPVLVLSIVHADQKKSLKIFEFNNSDVLNTVNLEYIIVAAFKHVDSIRFGFDIRIRCS